MQSRFCSIKNFFRKKQYNISDEIFVDVIHNEKQFQFLVTHPYDHIQGFHRVGVFYDVEELERFKSHFGGRPLRIVDVGANVGNHSIYMAHFLNCQWIAPIEPNQEILSTLRCNLGLNWSPAMDLRYLGYGLSDSIARAEVIQAGPMNTGASKVTKADHGSVPLMSGDEIFLGKAVDFIKIDVEGHELSVLRGLYRTIEKYRPFLYVETRNDTTESVPEYLDRLKYRVIYDYSRYEGVINFMFEPSSL